jgi:hypothetical protein
MGKREPQIILKTDERKVVLELGLAGKFAAKSSGWDENRFFLEGDKLEVAVKNGRWGCSRTCPQARDRRWAAAQENRMLFAHLKRILKLDRLRLRGPNGARDEFLLAATAQNLRKLAKLIPAPNLKPA